ncbi:MAG: hypothetical protein H5T69_05345 [Chloroflexi bacterium]|nr:hypothetical protein [Chloroflexota bacterium]
MQGEIDAGRLLLLSPFEPDAAYSPARAEARRVLLAAMSEALVLIAPEQPPEVWPTLPDFLVTEQRLFVWSGTLATIARAWVKRGAVSFDKAADVRRRLNELTGLGGPEADLGNAGRSVDDLPDVEPIAFTDAESAIEVLSRSGRVPDVLARRLRDMEWPNDLEYLVRYDDLGAEPSDER